MTPPLNPTQPHPCCPQCARPDLRLLTWRVCGSSAISWCCWDCDWITYPPGITADNWQQLWEQGASKTTACPACKDTGSDHVERQNGKLINAPCDVCRSNAPTSSQPMLSQLEGALVDPEWSPADEDDDDERPFCFTCQNTGWINCYCGGDLCVCENNGEFPCPKCDRWF